VGSGKRAPVSADTLEEYLEFYERPGVGTVDWAHLERLAEAAIYDRATRAPAELEEMADQHRAYAAKAPDPVFRRQHRWLAEVLTDARIAARLANLLPVVLVDAFKTSVDVHRHPYPLRAVWCRRFRCDNCGQDSGPPKVTFEDRVGPLSGMVEPSWCRLCIAAIAVEVEG
jgi:hypothetical protein